MEPINRCVQKDRAKKKAGEMAHPPPSNTDPGGSYTGKPADKTDKPIQDADDL